MCKAVLGWERSSGWRCYQNHICDLSLRKGITAAQQRPFSGQHSALSGGVSQGIQWGSMVVVRDHDNIVTMYALITVRS